MELSSEDDGYTSQQSTGSENQRLRLAIEEQLAATREKKRKEKEQKLSKKAQKLLTNIITEGSEDLKACMTAVYASG